MHASSSVVAHSSQARSTPALRWSIERVKANGLASREQPESETAEQSHLSAATAAIQQRLRTVFGLMSLRDISALTGCPPETVRRYLSSNAPSVPFLISTAAATGTRLEWLLMGRGLTTVHAQQLVELERHHPSDLLRELKSRGAVS